jgi:CheY-like chemotaxis protein
MAALHILLVEDHAESRELFERLLELDGHTVHPAGGISEALTLADAIDRLDLLVCDLGLPDGNGCDLLPTLRRKHPTVRGVAVSGHDEERFLAACQSAGFSAYVRKPVMFNQLLAAVNEAA